MSMSNMYRSVIDDTDSTNSSPNYSRATTPDILEDVIDIGGSRLQDTMLSELEERFLWTGGQTQAKRMFPASVFHNEAGLRMWAKITKLPDYYQTDDEIELLQRNGKELVEELGDALTLIDLGCGDVRKIEPLLSVLNNLRINVRYYALDLSKAVLIDSMLKLRSKYRNIKCFGIWGTFNDCFVWAQRDVSAKCYISLGSMFGNDHFNVAVAQLKSWADIMRPQDRMLLGLDGTKDRKTIWRSYHDHEGLFHSFILNGFKHSNVILGANWFQERDWELNGEFQNEPLMHHFVIKALRDVECKAAGLSFAAGEEIVCYEGFKYQPSAMHKQFKAAGLTQTRQWQSPSGRIYQYMLTSTALQG